MSNCFKCLHTELLHSNHFVVNTGVSSQTKPYYSETVKIIYIQLFQLYADVQGPCLRAQVRACRAFSSLRDLLVSLECLCQRCKKANAT